MVVGQRLTQGSPDIFLGWGKVDGKDFYVRQLADMKGSVKFNESDPTSIEASSNTAPCAAGPWRWRMPSRAIRR